MLEPFASLIARLRLSLAAFNSGDVIAPGIYYLTNLAANSRLKLQQDEANNLAANSMLKLQQDEATNLAANSMLKFQQDEATNLAAISTSRSRKT